MLLLVRVLSIAVLVLVLVLARFLRNRISPLDQSSQHPNDPFQVSLANPIPFGIDRNLGALDCSSVCVISETVTISEPVHASITKALRRIKFHPRVPNRIGERSFLANVGYLFVFLL